MNRYAERATREIAFHESAHAVIAIEEGIPIEKVTLTEMEFAQHEGGVCSDSVRLDKQIAELGQDWLKRQDFLTRMAKMGFAGELADVHINGRSVSVAKDKARQDMIPLDTFIQQNGLNREMRDRAMKDAKAYMNKWIRDPQNKSKIEKVAAALIERKTITEAEVRDLIT